MFKWARLIIKRQGKVTSLEIVFLKNLKKILRKQGVASLALFGSVARNEGQIDSDIDILIDVAPKFNFGLLEIVGVTQIIEDNLNRKVDVVLRDELSPAIKANILKDAEVVF